MFSLLYHDWIFFLNKISSLYIHLPSTLKALYYKEAPHLRRHPAIVILIKMSLLYLVQVRRVLRANGQKVGNYKNGVFCVGDKARCPSNWAVNR